MCIIRFFVFMVVLMALVIYFSGHFIDASRYHIRQTIEQIERSN